MVKIDCADKIIDHVCVAAVVSAVVVKFGHSFAFSPFAHLSFLQAGLVAGLMALVARVTEDIFAKYNILDDHKTMRKIAAYTIGFVAGGAASVAIASTGLTAASVSILGAVALAAIALGVSTLRASVTI